MNRSKTIKQLSSRSLIGIVYFVVVIVALHFLRPDLDPIGRPTSEYAVGKYGFLMTTAFLSMSLASLSLVFGLYKGISSSKLSRLGLILLGIWGIGVLVAMTFPINPEGTELTLSNTIHRVNGPLVFLSLTMGTFLLSMSFRRDKNWQTLYPSALTISLMMLVAFIVTGVNVATRTGYEGLCQRIFLVLFVIWFLRTTLHLRSAEVSSA